MEIEKQIKLTDREVSRRYGIGVQTLRNWRSCRQGPPYIKVTPGRRGKVLYDCGDLETWFKHRTITPEG